ncbi:MAG: hypothetical protein LBV80_12130 [Deltaproteobacteria bacterium]|jgi:hypothetical protein|nr:hypothetical protein [Deltaproteobacteria bacterium]
MMLTRPWFYYLQKAGQSLILEKMDITMPTNHTEFTVYYEGEALRDSRMDVRDLAPALLALGDMLEQANRVLNGDKATVRVTVKAFQPGCFGISLEITQSLSSMVLDLLKPGSETRDALEILNLLGFAPIPMVAVGGWSLFKLIKKMRGKNPKITRRLENGNISMEFDSEVGLQEKIEVSPELADLYADKFVRIAADKTVEPLRREGIDSLSLKHEDTFNPVISKTEEAFFSIAAAQQVDVPVSESKAERVLAIISLSFKEDNKWRLSDGSATLSVKISDPNFLVRVAEGKIDFAKGDMLKVLLSTKAISTSDGLKTEYEALQILDHIRATRQLFLPINADSEELPKFENSMPPVE